MSRPYPDDPFLRGNYAPWPMECDAHDLVVQGEIPRELNGTLYRNGPNPQFAPRSRYHWFDGDGMIHAFSLSEGRARYRNRWVRTAKFELERRHGESLFGGLASMTDSDERAMSTVPNAANTNIVFHAGRLLALWEAGLPHALDPQTLATLGAHDFAGKLGAAMTAHPKLDPESGEMLFFGYSPFPPFLTYHVVDREGALVRSEPIDVPVATMMHDFIVTREHVIFLVCPATFRAENMMTGGSPIRWEPELGTRIAVMPRNGGNADVVWFETDACYVFHPMNAYTVGRRIVADVARYPRVPLFDGEEAVDGLQDASSAKLVRWTLDLDAGKVREQALDEMPIEFPRLDERHAGLPYTHGYAAGRIGPPQPDGIFNALVHYDLERGARRVRDFGPHGFPMEPVFVPRKPDAPEGDGFLLALVYRADENRSDLVILDAAAIESGPLATVQLPHRVPYGFHGNWAEGAVLD